MRKKEDRLKEPDGTLCDLSSELKDQKSKGSQTGRISFRKLAGWLLTGIGLCLLALFLLLPYADVWRTNHLLASFESTVSRKENLEMEAEMKKAREWNRALEQGILDLSIPETVSEYYKILDLHDGIMASIEIPAIDVRYPICHGTDDRILSAGAGHIMSSSLPVGGKGTHTAISAHSGSASGRLFTRLDELGAGDLFFIHTGDQTLAYRVFEIRTVLPDDTEVLKIEKGRDLASLITCTPYGINSHRLVVTGKRIPYQKGEERKVEKKALSPLQTLLQAIPVIVLSLALLILYLKWKKKRTVKKKGEES